MVKDRYKQDVADPHAPVDLQKLRVFQTQSSVAGAGSNRFHQYRFARRREQERLAAMESEAKEEEEREDWEKLRAFEKDELERVRDKKRKKRKRKKEASRARKKQAAAKASQVFENDGSFLEKYLSGELNAKDDSVAVGGNSPDGDTAPVVVQGHSSDDAHTQSSEKET